MSLIQRGHVENIADGFHDCRHLFDRNPRTAYSGKSHNRVLFRRNLRECLGGEDSQDRESFIAVIISFFGYCRISGTFANSRRNSGIKERTVR